MLRTSIRDRLSKPEDRRRFLDWFVWHRLYATLTLEELERSGKISRTPELPSLSADFRLSELSGDELRERLFQL